MFNPAALEPYQPFFPPVPPPGTGACDTPLVCVSFSASWQPYVLSALKALLMDSSWATTDTSVLSATRNAASDLIEAFSADGCTPELRIDPIDPTYVDVSPDGSAWYRVPKPSDLLHFLVDNPGVLRDNGISPVSGHFGLVVNALDQVGIGVTTASAVYPAMDLYQSGDGSGHPPLRLGRANSSNHGFLQLFSTPVYREVINRRMMYTAPQLDMITADANDQGGIYIKADDNRGYIIIPDGSGGWIQQRIGEGDGSGDGIVAAVTADYVVGLLDAPDTLTDTGSPTVPNMRLKTSEKSIAFTPHFTSLPDGSDPTVIITRTGVNAYQADMQSPPIPFGTPLPDITLPLTGLKALTFMIDARGSILPFLFPTGYGINAIDVLGFWGWVIDPGTGNIKISSGNVPSAPVNETDLQLWLLGAPINPTLGQNRLGYTGAIDAFVAVSDLYLMFAMKGSTGTVSPFDPNAFGQLYITLTIAAPGGGSYDWHIDLDFTVADDRQNASFNFSGGAGTWVSGEGYGDSQPNGSVELHHLLGDGTTTVAFARVVCKLSGGVAGTGSPDVEKYLYVNNGAPYIFNAASVPFVNQTYDMNGTITPVIASNSPTGGGIVQNQGSGGTRGRISISSIHVAGFGTPPTFHP